MSNDTGYKYLPPSMAERLRNVEIMVRPPMGGHHQGRHKSSAFGRGAG
ncbi:MAG: hypothetical protein K9M57_09850 [Phycisphaerae bacterium]|nr:hypothetical protein [Phycisphaerae bacterium]